MSWGKHSQSRDANEPDIIKALVAIGASVTKLSGAGIPDLLVSYHGVLSLLEVKNLDSSTHGKKTTKRGVADPMAYLTTAQRKWWASWRGKAPVIVTTASEAIAAVTARGDGDRAAEGKPEALDEARVMSSGSVIEEVIQERARQDRKWGGPAHDDNHERYDFVRFVREHLDDARRQLGIGDTEQWRIEMIQIAALAIAAVESSDRKLARCGS